MSSAEDVQEEVDTESLEVEAAETPIEDAPILDSDEDAEEETSDAAEVDDKS